MAKETSQLLAHEGSISRLSPFLFLSLFLLLWNLVFTAVGVYLNEINPKQLQNIYIVSVVCFPFFCVIPVHLKYVVLCCKCFEKRTCHKFWKLCEALLYDLIFVAMGTLYLAGDNLPIFICSTKDEVDREECRGQSSIILGVSLLLHAMLYLAGIFKLKVPTPPIYPVTGRIRRAYQNILQLGSLTIFLDQTFSTVVRQYVTHLNIEADEIRNCARDCVGNITETDCLAKLNAEVWMFLAALTAILLFIALGLIVKNLKDYCSCCLIDFHAQYHKVACWNLVENILIIFIQVICVTGFMVIYALADNRWLWICVIEDKDLSFNFRVGLLYILLASSFVLILMYIIIICLPGLGIVKKYEKGFFQEYEYAEILAKQHNSGWKCERALAHAKHSTRSGDHSESQSRPPPPFDITENISEIAVEDNHGTMSISVHMEGKTTCMKGLGYLCNKTWDCFEGSKSSAEPSDHEDNSHQHTTYWEQLQKECQLRSNRNTRCCVRTRETEEETKLLTYGNNYRVEDVTLAPPSQDETESPSASSDKLENKEGRKQLNEDNEYQAHLPNFGDNSQELTSNSFKAMDFTNLTQRPQECRRTAELVELKEHRKPSAGVGGADQQP